MSDPYAKACISCGHLPQFHEGGRGSRCTLSPCTAGLCEGYRKRVGRFHFSRFTICPLTWCLDMVGKCSTADDIDMWASDRGWWSRG